MINHKVSINNSIFLVVFSLLLQIILYLCHAFLFNPWLGNLPITRGGHFYARSPVSLYGGFVPPCRVLMHLLPWIGGMQWERRNRFFML